MHVPDAIASQPDLAAFAELQVLASQPENDYLLHNFCNSPPNTSTTQHPHKAASIQHRKETPLHIIRTTHATRHVPLHHPPARAAQQNLHPRRATSHRILPPARSPPHLAHQFAAPLRVPRRALLQPPPAARLPPPLRARDDSDVAVRLRRRRHATRERSPSAV